VKRATLDPLAPAVQQPRSPRKHFARSPARESQQYNVLRRNTGLNEVCDAKNERTGLAGARTRDNEVRPTTRRSSLILLCVELALVVERERRNSIEVGFVTKNKLT
jgi:hypothetical protein